MFPFITAEEDWGGKNSKSTIGKRRSKHSMLNKCVPVAKHIPKLANRHRKKYDKFITVHTYNECSFDSLFQVYAALYMDYECIKFQVDRIENSDFCNMIVQACEENRKSLTNLNDLYVVRDTIMQNVVSNKHNTIRSSTGLISINCISNIDYIVEHVLPQTMFSYVRKKLCESCGMCIESNRCFIDINFEKFAQKNVTIKNLGKLLAREMNAEAISSKCTNKSCGEIFKIESTFSNVVMIDLQTPDRQTNKRFSINQVPSVLKLCRQKFRIVALIEYIRDDDNLMTEEVEDIGHYVAHIKRINEIWEKYDDCVPKIENSDRKRMMEVHTLFYMKVTSQ